MLPSLAQAQASAAAGGVDFLSEVHPVLAQRCLSCHSGNQPMAGLSLASREGALAGGASGPSIVPGSAHASLLVGRISGTKGSRMPPSGEPLSAKEIAVIRKWIDQGAQWGEAPKQTQYREAPLALRKPPVPESAQANAIDKFTERYFRANGVEFTAPVSDGQFARRAYLDVWGLAPSPEQLEQFLAGARENKREQLVESLLQDTKKYSEHWISFWNDLLRNDEGVVYHGERKSITPWVLKALQSNMPYHRFVTALLNPVEKTGPEGFLAGVNWRGTVNASQTPAMQAAQNSAQVFLGINLKCASCHDSFVSRWKLKQSYGLASFFNEEPSLEIVRCDVKTGEMSRPEFLYPELGRLQQPASLAERREAAARFITTPENGRFARTIVNRIWHRLMGRGMVEPLDDMDAEPWDQDLLDWLAADFVEQGHDLKRLIRMILTSRTYQMPAVDRPGGEQGKYVFRGPEKRRLTAEQFVDSISAITGEWRTLQSQKAPVYSRDWRLKSTYLTRALGRPIRDQVYTERNQEATTFQAMELVNGNELAGLLRKGARRILGEEMKAPASLFDSRRTDRRVNTASVDVDISGARELWLVTDDLGSYAPERVMAGWADAELTGPRGTVKLSELKTMSEFRTAALSFDEKTKRESLVLPKVPATLVYDISGKGFTRFRATAGIDRGSFGSDINPIVRFFVFTQKPDFDQLAQVEGETPLPRPSYPKEPGAVVERLYLHAFSRKPTGAESAAALEYLGGKLTVDGVEDLLWSLFLQPEFQFLP